MDIRKQLLNILDQLPDTPAEHDLMPHLNNLNRIIQECETKEEYRGQQQQFEQDLNASVPVQHRVTVQRDGIDYLNETIVP